jgi:NAD+ kinase
VRIIQQQYRLSWSQTLWTPIMSADAAFKNIALIGSSEQNQVAVTLSELTQHLLGRNLNVAVEESLNLTLPVRVTRQSIEYLCAHSDLVITIGGDGTMLRAARLFAGSGVPLVGINRGRLGFLADINPKDIINRIDEVLAGQYTRGSRSLLQVRLLAANGTVQRSLAVNDCVLQKWETGRLLDYETWIDGQYVNTHGGDGVIVASATGSTAYALSCGGPIIHPHLDALVIAPICPHTLSDRPIVISSSSTIEIRRVQDRATKAQVTCDGDMLGDLNMGDRLLIEPSHLRVNFLHPTDHDYYRILRSKLHWGRGALDKRIEDDLD